MKHKNPKVKYFSIWIYRFFEKSFKMFNLQKFQSRRVALQNSKNYFSYNSSNIETSVSEQLEKAFLELSNSDNKTQLKTYLTRECFEKLKNKRTPTYRSTLLDCIQAGIANMDCTTGVRAPDPEAYTVFAELFNPIIMNYNSGGIKTKLQPKIFFGNGKDFEDLDPQKLFIISTRIRCSRTIVGYPFPTRMNEREFFEVESILKKALTNLDGNYLNFTENNKKLLKELARKHFVFEMYNEAGNIKQHWPSGRGLFFNSAMNFFVWVNHNDHLSIISMEKSGNFGKAYERLIGNVGELSKQLKFNYDRHLGFLTTCPSNLGTALRASVFIKLPKLTENLNELIRIALKHNLVVQRPFENQNKMHIYQVSNYVCKGRTEYKVVRNFYKGVRALIAAERRERSKKYQFLKRRQIDMLINYYLPLLIILILL